MRRKFVIVNPVGSGLAHYTRSLESVLSALGTSVTVLSIDEPSSSGRGPFRWLCEYCSLLLRARRSRDGAEMIVTWPVVGYWDFLLARALLGRDTARLVLHDPQPLVRAKGYGRTARQVAGLGFVRAKPLVHSEGAANVVRAQAENLEIASLPHPMFPPREPTRRSGRPVIRVLGQYKSDRDVASLRALAESGSSAWRYEIIGRGWAAIPGWKVSDRFVEESEFDALIRDSSVILIPYLRFFQSGVAIRSLEMGTPVVGPRVRSLADLLGVDSPWLVNNEPWDRAIDAAIEAGPQEVFRIATSVYSHVLEQWRRWLTGGAEAISSRGGREDQSLTANDRS